MIRSQFSSGFFVRRTLLLSALAIFASTIVLLLSPHSWFILNLNPGSADWAARECNYNEKDANAISLTQEECNLTSGSGRPVYLLGDSNAAHHSDGLKWASVNLDRPLFVLYAGSCPTMPVSMTSEVGRHVMEERDANNRCLPWVDFVSTELGQATAGTVVLSISPSYWDANYVSIAPLGDALSGDQKTVLEEALLKQVREISALGHEVVLVSPMVSPQFVCRETIVNLMLGRMCSPSEEGLTQWNSDALDSFHVVKRESGVRMVDLTELQCPGMECARTVDGVKIYSLGYSHLAAEFSTLTGPEFFRVLKALE